ncbi:MAG: hypothetical protein P8017_04805 [Deltaproteobacteria bacterium]
MRSWHLVPPPIMAILGPSLDLSFAFRELDGGEVTLSVDFEDLRRLPLVVRILAMEIVS